MPMCDFVAMPSFSDLSEIGQDLSRRDLPFVWYAFVPDGDTLGVEVAPGDVEAAETYFAKHSLRLADGTDVPVRVTPRRGASWMSLPGSHIAQPSETFEDGSLLGIEVHEAARRVNAAGWIVRAYEHEALLTADFNPRRLNLRYDDDLRVDSIHHG
jgi:hypothetical protein